MITVKTDCGTNKLTVIGKMDVLAVKEKLELKTKKKVELISPQPKKDGGAGEKKAEEKKPEQNKTPEEKPKEVKNINHFSKLKNKLFINFWVCSVFYSMETEHCGFKDPAAL